MATADQSPGELDLVVVQGDDLNIQLSVDENLSGYTFVTTLHALHGGNTTAQTVLSSGTSTSTVQISFPATTTAALDVTGDEGAHNWWTVYTDTSSLTRTWVAGSFTVLAR
jgi:hypothetical protein